METNKISMREAFLIETLRSNGVSNEDILAKLEQGDVQNWETTYPNNEFSALIKLYEEDKTAFQSILLDGYSVKFVTMNGLKNLLRMKYNLLEERDYVQTENGIAQLKIEEPQYTSLKQLLSINWTIHEHANESNDSTSKLISIQLAGII